MGLPVFGTETYTNSLKQLERLTHQMTATFVCGPGIHGNFAPSMRGWSETEHNFLCFSRCLFP